jgi:hypothetical protein
MESRKIGSRLRRHYEHAMAAGTPTSRRAPLGYRIEGRGDQRRYVLDDRPLAGDLTVADAGRLLIETYLEKGTIWSSLKAWKGRLRALEPVHDEQLLSACLGRSLEACRGWLESAAAELQGHVARTKSSRITGDDGSVTYQRLPWSEWELSRDRHEPLIDAATARRVLAQLEENRNRGTAVARGRQAANPDAMPSFTPVAFCGACGRRLRQQSTRAGTRPGDPPYRTLRCSGAKTANPLCDQRGISERALCYGLVPLLIAESDRVAQLMLPPAEGGQSPIDPDLVEQIGRTRELAAATGLPELRRALLALESRAAGQAAAAAEAQDVEISRQAMARQLRELLPTIGPDLYTVSAARKQVLQAIERIEVRDGKVAAVQLKG